MSQISRADVLATFEHHYTYGGRLFESVPAPMFCRVPFPGMKHPAWIAGHISVPQRRLAQHLGVAAPIPEGWAGLFMRTSDPIPEAPPAGPAGSPFRRCRSSPWR